ncbi:Uncharacterised protein [Shigella sonnei]|nr:Uncharacterised protein [Shigella sonnei]
MYPRANAPITESTVQTRYFPDLFIVVIRVRVHRDVTFCFYNIFVRFNNTVTM